MTRRQLAAGWSLTLAAFAAGVVLLWDYLGREHARLTPAQVALVWCSEAVSGFWFLRFGWRHVVRGRPLVAPGPAERRIVIITLVAGWLLDAAVTGYKIADENAAKRRAVAVVGRLLTGHGTPNLIGHRNYRLAGEYTDPAGDTHPVTYAGSDKGLPGAARVAVDLGRLPAPLPLRYDPQQPARYWLTGERTNEGKLANLSLMALAFQFLLVYAWMIESHLGGRPGMPPEQLLGFGVAALTLFVLGCTYWLFGSIE